MDTETLAYAYQMVVLVFLGLLMVGVFIHAIYDSIQRDRDAIRYGREDRAFHYIIDNCDDNGMLTKEQSKVMEKIIKGKI